MRLLGTKRFFWGTRTLLTCDCCPDRERIILKNIKHFFTPPLLTRQDPGKTVDVRCHSQLLNDVGHIMLEGYNIGLIGFCY